MLLSGKDNIYSRRNSCNFAMSNSDINTVIDQFSYASVDGSATLSFAGRGLKLDSEADGRLFAKSTLCLCDYYSFRFWGSGSIIYG